jgi:hypothetical protein
MEEGRWNKIVERWSKVVGSYPKNTQKPNTAQCCPIHCKEPRPKIPNKYSQTRICDSPNFHIHVSVSDIYSHDRSAYCAAGNMWTYPGNIK